MHHHAEASMEPRDESLRVRADPRRSRRGGSAVVDQRARAEMRPEFAELPTDAESPAPP